MSALYSIESDELDILLEEEAEYRSFYTLRKLFIDDEGKDFFKAQKTENGYKLEFSRLSKQGSKIFFNYINDDSFGNPKITENFMESLRGFDAFERILSILNHTVLLREDWAFHTYAKGYLNQVIKEINSSNSSKKRKEKKAKPYLKSLTACNSFLWGYHGKLSEELYSAVDTFRNSEGINEIKYLIDNKKSIINTNTKTFLLSPLLFPFNQWKNLVLHEFTIIQDIDRFDSYKKRFISLVNELKYRINSKEIPFLSSYTGANNDQAIDMLYLHHINWGIDSFTNPIEQYLEYINSISLDEVRNENRNLLLEKLKKQEQERVKLLNAKRNSKIYIKKNYRHVIKGLMYLFLKYNPELERISARKMAEKVGLEIFHLPIRVEKHSLPQDLKFSNQLLLEYLIFLEKNGYVEYNPKVSIPKVISENCSLKIKGKTQSNLYHILKKLSYSPNDIQNIKLTLLGLTSEIALLNEMKN